jgi:hypothetical protein
MLLFNRPVIKNKLMNLLLIIFIHYRVFFKKNITIRSRSAFESVINNKERDYTPKFGMEQLQETSYLGSTS